jgi:hypothetical protein
MALTKAQIAKLQADLKKTQAELKKAQATAAKKPAAPTSGAIAGFKPEVIMPAPAARPGEPGFVGPVVPTPKPAPTPRAANDYLGLEPLGGPGADIVSNFNAPVVTTEPPPAKEERTMAIDTFRNTLALLFGAEEVNQPWVNALYGVTSKYYKTGSTIDESLNLALKDVRDNPELASFTKRFKGVYDLQDRFNKGEVVEVPTIAAFFKSQLALGDIFTRAGLPDLNNREFLGEVLGTGKSVSETTALVNNVFAAIDNAPEALKADLQRVAPGADRTAIARALLLGKQGADALTKQIAATSVFSASKSQGIGAGGLGIDMATAADYAARGFDYNTALTGFGNVARGAAPLEKLTEISTGKAIKPEDAQKTLQQSIFENNVVAQEQIRTESEREAARFGGRSGTLGSRSLASRNRANRAI